MQTGPKITQRGTYETAFIITIPYEARLAVRGHDSSEGNLFQLLQLRSEDDAQLGVWLRENKYFSTEIVNEQIQLMANSVLHSILLEIHSTGWFAIIADEATDVHKCEQMCICIR